MPVFAMHALWSAKADTQDNQHVNSAGIHFIMSTMFKDSLYR